ncbi:ATP-binding protein [Pigmentiphaga soli]|uniref:histidine kinase n=1 Tax=Pigmentiphaga soli TaxID=1007095 RepID=A0ABP8H5M5_9BURK
MALRRYAAWTVLGILLAVAASLPMWLRLPEPRGALAIGTVACIRGCDARGPVQLPLAEERRGGRAEYRLAFSLAALPDEPLYLFIPMLNQRAIVSLAGRQIADTGTRTLMIGVTSGMAALVPLPANALRRGVNTIDVALLASGAARGYLSRLYVGTAGQVATPYRLQLFLLEHVRLMALAAQLLITFAVLVAWIYRPREALFGWMFLLLAVSLLGYAGLVAELNPTLRTLPPYAFTMATAAAFILQIIALLVNGSRVPRWLKTCAWAVPLACTLFALSGVVAAHRVGLWVGFPVLLLGLLSAIGISAWGALAKGVKEAWLLLVPLLLLAVALLHDGAILAMWTDGPVYLGIYYRQALTVGIAIVLARRLGLSMMQLDEANAHLKRRLAEREAELGRLHEEERKEAAQRVRSEERQRLTADLHDGLSGHLASIIALAERERSTSIERSAREALDDLRAVIHSLDIGDRELTVALSGFRERLERQLKRVGIALHWSMARLPEISGVTPAHALNVLRIMQEAITNAARHGPATRIQVQGRPGPAGQAVITIQNDGTPFCHGCGSGLENMRRRAAVLGGAIQVEALETGTLVTLVLPGRLPAPLGEEAARTA